MMQEWHYRNGEQIVGPIDAKAIRLLSKSGQITPRTLVRRGDDADSFRAARINGLFDGHTASQVESPCEQDRDPLVAIASDAASAVATSATAAASAIGGALTKLVSRRDEPKVTVAAATSPPSWVSMLARDNQSPEVVELVADKVRGILMSDEQIIYIAVQNKPVVNWKPDCIVLTNRRFIFCRPKLFGRVDFEDYVWRELHDAKLSENVIGSTFSISTASGVQLSLDYLPKSQARAVYRLAQEAEEAALAVRRSLRLEDDRAKAGGVVVQTNLGIQGPSTPTVPNSSDAPLDKLKSLKGMADAGLITLAEFESKKAEILARMTRGSKCPCRSDRHELITTQFARRNPRHACPAAREATRPGCDPPRPVWLCRPRGAAAGQRPRLRRRVLREVVRSLHGGEVPHRRYVSTSRRPGVNLDDQARIACADSQRGRVCPGTLVSGSMTSQPQRQESRAMWQANRPRNSRQMDALKMRSFETWRSSGRLSSSCLRRFASKHRPLNGERLRDCETS